MKKSERDSIIKIIKTLFLAHDDIKKYIEREDNDKAVFLLEECQKVAIQIGTMIETIEGTGGECVTLLESYCEDVYEIAQEVKGDIDEQEAQERLDKKLIQIKNINQEIKSTHDLIINKDKKNHGRDSDQKPNLLTRKFI